MTPVQESDSLSPFNHPELEIHKQASRVIQLPPSLGPGELTDLEGLQLKLSLAKEEKSELEKKVTEVSARLQQLKETPTPENLTCLENSACSLHLFLAKFRTLPTKRDTSYATILKHLKITHDVFGLDQKLLENYLRTMERFHALSQEQNQQLRTVSTHLERFKKQLKEEYQLPSEERVQCARTSQKKQWLDMQFDRVKFRYGRWPFIDSVQEQNDLVLLLARYRDRLIQEVPEEPRVILFTSQLSLYCLNAKRLFDTDTIKDILKEYSLEFLEEKALLVCNQMQELTDKIRKMREDHKEILEKLEGREIEYPFRIYQKRRNREELDPRSYFPMLDYLDEILVKIKSIGGRLSF